MLEFCYARSYTLFDPKPPYSYTKQAKNYFLQPYTADRLANELHMPNVREFAFF